MELLVSGESTSQPAGAVSLQPGQVALVGAGPGSADLITVRGLRLLQQADVVVHDSLADASLYAGLAAETIDVGKRAGVHKKPQHEIEALLVELAGQGKRVVRLKGGDPFVFGRGSEELVSLAAAGVSTVVVPGVSSSVAGPLLAGIPVTHRRVADGFCVVSGHLHKPGMSAIPPYHPNLTVVVLMGVRTLPTWHARMRALGYPDELPMAFVCWAARPEQRLLVTTMSRALDDCARFDLKAPAVAVIGRVVAVRAWVQAVRAAGERVEPPAILEPDP
jgi:uroporphyrin-III C-methyltransferase